MSEKGESLPKQMFGSLFSPRKTFESIQGRDLRSGFLIILIIGIISALAGYSYSSKLPIPQLPNLPQNGGFSNPGLLRSNFMIIRALGGGIVIFIDWLVLSALVYLVGRLVIGKGSFRRMLALMAFASVPLLIQQALRLLDSATASSDTLLSLTSAISTTTSIGGRLFTQTISVFTAFGLWAFVLALIAVSVNYGSSKKRAFVATISAYLVFILIGTVLPL